MTRIPELKSAEAKLRSLLAGRKEKNCFRQLRSQEGLVDFCSNDYLGLARSQTLFDLISQKKEFYSSVLNGSGGSRLLSGNHSSIQNLEKRIAEFHESESALIFNSGYAANTSLLSSIASADDLVIYDELSHASIIDGVRLSNAQSIRFRHNDLTDLELKLRSSDVITYVVVESVYSMGGDIAPLKEIASLCQKYHAELIVDEAHSTGLYGSNGQGLVQEYGLTEEVFARVHTFGKALGTHGAAVLGKSYLKDFLVNYARSFIYSTALSPHSYASIAAAYELIPKLHKERNQLEENITYFRNLLKDFDEGLFLHSATAIQSVIIPGNHRVKELSALLSGKGFDIRAILNPTVTKGKERLRIIIHSYNTKNEMESVLSLIDEFNCKSLVQDE